MRKFLDLLDKELLSFVLRAGIRIYQVGLGWLFRGACRFEPSCSRYSEEAIRKYGALRGSVLTIRRLLKCHPFHGGGVDPVP